MGTMIGGPAETTPADWGASKEEQQGFDPYVDQDGLRPGEAITEELQSLRQIAANSKPYTSSGVAAQQPRNPLLSDNVFEAYPGHVFLDEGSHADCTRCGWKRWALSPTATCEGYRAPQQPDMVNHPAHYGGRDDHYEAIKVIEAWKLDFHLGTLVKYVARAGKKPGSSEIEDLKKARWYLDRAISRRETMSTTNDKEN